MEPLGSRRGRKRNRRGRTNRRKMSHTEEPETYAMAIGLMLVGGLLFLNGVGISIAGVILPTVSHVTVIAVITLLTLATYLFAGVPLARQTIVQSWMVVADAIASRVENRARRKDPNRL